MTLQRHEPTTIGSRLMRILEQRNLTLSDLSQRSGVSPSQLSLLTRGKIQAPRTATVLRLADALGVPESALMRPDGADYGQRGGPPGTDRVALVSIVTINPGDGRLLDTGDTLVAPTALLVGRKRLLAAVVDGGYRPDVQAGDTVVFDPDARPAVGNLVLVCHGHAQLAARHAERAGRSFYRLADGSWLPPERIHLAGVILTATHPVPSYTPDWSEADPKN
jgi:DNA-binding Xre family transcriptional regulator